MSKRVPAPGILSSHISCVKVEAFPDRCGFLPHMLESYIYIFFLCVYEL